jgi:hypothetical protein
VREVLEKAPVVARAFVFRRQRTKVFNRAVRALLNDRGVQVALCFEVFVENRFSDSDGRGDLAGRCTPEPSANSRIAASTIEARRSSDVMRGRGDRGTSFSIGESLIRH